MTIYTREKIRGKIKPVRQLGYRPSSVPLQLCHESLAQQNTGTISQPPSDIKQLLLSKTPLIDVEYQSGSTIVLRADENTLIISNGTLSPFWTAIDLAKRYGYTLNDVTTSGMGSQGNPTRFFAIMSKP
jgi:hypothetical protein